MGQRATLTVAGSGWKLRREIPRSRAMARHSGSSHGPAIALAERLRRAADRIDSSRVSGSRDCCERGQSAANPRVLLRLLRKLPDTPLVGQGHACQSTDSTRNNRTNRRNPSGRRAAPSLRTNRSVIKLSVSLRMQDRRVNVCPIRNSAGDLRNGFRNPMRNLSLAK